MMGLCKENNHKHARARCKSDWLAVVQTLCITCILSFDTGAQNYVNPLRGTITTHDPCIIKNGDTYHVFYTGNLIQHVASIDRINWTFSGPTISGPGWIKTYVPNNSGTDIWAPDISYRSGKYWLYYSVSTFGSNTSAIGLSVASSLTNPQWSDQGMVINSTSSSNFNCIDPNSFYDTDGKLWLAFGSFWNGINVVQLDTATGKPASSQPTVTNIATHAGGIEAPFLFKRGKYYYLFVSWDKCCQGAGSTYNIRFGRATSITGPYFDSAATSMKSGGGTLLWSGDGRWKGPGAQNVFVDHDTTFLVCHAYDANANGAVTLIIRPLYWTTSEWPTLTVTGIVNPMTRVATKKTSVMPQGGADVTHKIVGNRSIVPDEIMKSHCLCMVYSLQGRMLYRVPVTKEIDLGKQFGNVSGVYLLRFIKEF
jgi:arabinan endo-1,5-alpha-L-arabinosidase